MLMKVINCNLLNKSLEFLFNSRFSFGKNGVVFIVLFLALSIWALEKFFMGFISKIFRVNKENY